MVGFTLSPTTRWAVVSRDWVKVIAMFVKWECLEGIFDAVE
jgi:hypothetical protein